MDLYPILLPLAYVAIILGITWLAARITSIVIGRLMDRSSPLVATQARRAGWALVWIIGAVIAVEEVGVRSDILLLVVGLFGVAVIVALRVPLENLSAKYFADMYVPFKVGDSVSVQGHAGKVIEINPMSTILLANDDTLVAIPSSTFLHEAFVNTTPQAWKEVLVPIALGADADVATFESALRKSLNKLKLHLDERFPPILTMKGRTSQSTELTLTVMIRQPGQREMITSEVNKRVAEVLAAMPSRWRVRTAPTETPQKAAG